MPCFGKSPSATAIWQRPQIPRPPHTESRSAPSLRAASSTLVPSGKRPRLPEGVKTTRCSWATETALLHRRSPTPFAPAPTARFRDVGGRLAVFADPEAAIGVMAHHHVSAQNRLHVLRVERVHDRRRHACADHYRQEGGIQSA